MSMGRFLARRDGSANLDEGQRWQYNICSSIRSQGLSFFDGSPLLRFDTDHREKGPSSPPEAQYNHRNSLRTTVKVHYITNTSDETCQQQRDLQMTHELRPLHFAIIGSREDAFLKFYFRRSQETRHRDSLFSSCCAAAPFSCSKTGRHSYPPVESSIHLSSHHQ
jgi:hypothetical protein